jgi:hypothetical protein
MRTAIPSLARHTVAVLLSAVCLLACCAGCSEGTPMEPDADLLVVRAYLYAGQPVSDIQLTGTLPLGSADSIAPPVNDASVALVKEGRRYPLERSAGDSGYYRYAGADLAVLAGDRFDLVVQHRGRTVTAHTTVPVAPQAVALSRDTMMIPENPDFTFLRGDSSRVSVSWTGATAALWYVVVENLEANPEPIVLPNAPFNRARQRFIAPPTEANAFTIGVMNLTHYGRHRVTVYRINEEYAGLYRTRQQDSRDLNEPLTNIVNGLGIFSAFHGAATTLVVTKR